MLKRVTEASEINAILNHPSVRPWVADVSEGLLDVSDRVGNPANVTLVGEHGAFFCFKYTAGLYEVHTAVLQSGRGAWARDFAEAGARYMFTQTDCVEILTRVPQGHVAAKALTEAVGFQHQFTTPADCMFRGEMVPAHVYSLPLQQWFPRARDVEEEGAAFHAWLVKQVGNGSGQPHGADPAHNRIVGVTMAMIMGGQVRKGVVFYNTRSFAARHPTIALLNEDPPQIRFDVGVLTVKNGGICFERTN